MSRVFAFGRRNHSGCLCQLRVLACKYTHRYDGGLASALDQAVGHGTAKGFKDFRVRGRVAERPWNAQRLAGAL
jgi:hypothetical protein